MKKSQVINRLATLLAQESDDAEAFMRGARRQAKSIRELQNEIDHLHSGRAYDNSHFSQVLEDKQSELAHIHEVYGKVCEEAVLLLQSLPDRLCTALMLQRLADALRAAGYNPTPTLVDEAG